MQYPKSRKSPRSHKVHKHDRSGKPITSYTRGSGKQAPTQPKRPRGKPANVVKEYNSIYSVILDYSTHKESYKFNSTSFYDAAVNGMTSRKDDDIPGTLIVRRSK